MRRLANRHPARIKISGNAHLSHGITSRIHGINASNRSSHVRYLTWSPPLSHAAKAHPSVKISGNAHLGHGMTSRIHGINARNESSHVRYLTWSPPLKSRRTSTPHSKNFWQCPFRSWNDLKNTWY